MDSMERNREIPDFVLEDCMKENFNIPSPSREKVPKADEGELKCTLPLTPAPLP